MVTSFVPPRDTEAYRWWERGAEAEAQARRDGRSKATLDLLDVVDGLGQHHRDWSAARLAMASYVIYAGHMPWWQQLRLWWSMWWRSRPPRRQRKRHLRRAVLEAEVCPAHGDAGCVLCSASADGATRHCSGCDFFAETGMHWDTCPNRVKEAQWGK